MVLTPTLILCGWGWHSNASSLLSHREVRLHAKPVIRMHSNETVIEAKDGTLHRFCYDYSFWSLNHLQDYACQNTVYGELAQPLLDRAFEGYNTCLFAYGQVSVSAGPLSLNSIFSLEFKVLWIITWHLYVHL